MGAADSLELEIRNLLLSRYSPREVLANLIDRLYDPSTSFRDRRTILIFANNAGLYKQAMTRVSDLLRNRQQVPLSVLLEFFARTRLAPDNDTAESIIKGARRQEQVADLVTSRAWDKFLPSMLELRREVQAQREVARLKQRQNLLDKLAFFRNERMAEEEQRLLELLRKMYPEDAEIQKLRQEFTDRWARHVIAKHARDEVALPDITQTLVTPEEEALVRPAFEAMLEICVKRPDMVYEFCVALLVMDFDDWALEILGSAPPDYAENWLRAEVLLRGRRYIDCLDHLVQLESLYGADPETAFAVTYFRAQALWGLDQHSRALELLQTLINVRPNYRSATSLFKDWTGG